VTPPYCPHCGGATRLRFVAFDRNRRLSDERFRYWECERCGLLFLSPVPADIGRFYPPDYYALPPSRAALVTASRPHDAYKVDLLDRLRPPGRRLVEVGPGIGGFAALAQDAGYDISVIEMDERACAFLSREVGVATHHTADADGALRREGPFDAVALWHVIEHLPAPFATLQAVADALAPGGVAAFHDYGHPEYPGVREAVAELHLDGYEEGGLFVWRQPVSAVNAAPPRIQ
jgi:SAM-dependent methyltransferase